MAVVTPTIGSGASRTTNDGVGGLAEPWAIRAFRSARVRVVVIVLAALLAAGTAYYQLVVLPELSSVRYELWVAGSENDLRVEVDLDSSLVHITGAPSGLPELIVANGAVYMPIEEFSGGDPEGVEWIEIPLDEIDPRYSALTSDRVSAAISRKVEHCEAPSADAIDVVDLLLPSASPRSDGFSICERGVGLAADVGSDVLVSVSRVRPDETARLVPERSVSYLELGDPETVLARLELNQ